MSINNAIKQAHAVLTNDKPAEHLSKRYTLINTAGLIDTAEKLGFTVQSVRYPKSRKGQATSMHIVRLDHAEFLKGDNKEERPQIIITNSHDGSSRLRIMAGVFRLVCSNGLIAGNAFLNIKLFHIGLKQSDIEEQLKIACQKTLELNDIVKRLKGTTLDPYSMPELLNDALRIRAKAAGLDEFETNSLLNDWNRSRINRVRRLADNSLDAWTVLNRLQENALQASQLVYSDIQGEKHYLKGVSDIRKTVDINQQLWDLIERKAA